MARQRPWAVQTDPIRLHGGPFGVASPGPIPKNASTPSACGTWTELSPDQNPFVRDDHSLVYDPVRDRLLIFGGTTASQGDEYWSNEVWALSLSGSPSLTQITASGTPPTARSDATMIYDSARDRLVVFGGIVQSGGASNDVWELTLSGMPTWNEITPAGTLPPTLAYHTAIYDASRDRMIVFGGYDYGGGGDRNEVWVLAFGATPTWSLMTPSGTPPSPRSIHSAVYDGPRDRMVVFGGYSGSSATAEQNDTWALSLSGSGSWSQITPSGGPPAIRYGHTAIVDAPRSRMLVFGGFVDDVPYEYGDVWSLSFTNPIKWTQLSPTGPTPVPAPYFSLVYDPVRQRMISFSADEFWALSNLSGTPAWSMLTPAGQVPRRRWGAAVIYDAPRQRMVLFGGYVAPEGRRANDLWAYSLTGGTWSRIVSSSQAPAVRYLSTAIYDPGGDRMILFGGGNDLGVLNDTWQLSLAGSPSWTHLSPAGTTPPGRNAHTAILDAPRNRMVIYGGLDIGSNALSDVWALSLSGGTSWSALSPTGGPAPARAYHSAVFDAPRNRMLAFGWNDNSVWALGLAGTPSWSTLATTGTPPPALGAHSAAYDAARDRMLIGMGETVGSSNNTTYELRLAGTPAWGSLGSTSPLPAPRAYAGALFDTGGDRWVLFGGNNLGQNLNDVEALSFPSAYPLNVQASPPAGGTVQQDPAGECYLPGTTVTLTAVPAANYSFVGWSGDVSGSTNPLTVTMDGAKSITANFDNFTLNVTVSPPGSGTVTRNPNLTYYPPNSQVTITANAATGYAFQNWSGDATGSANPVTVTMTSSKSVTANFVGYPVNVTVSPAGSGSVSKNPNQATYVPGTQVTLTASSGFPFLGWSGDASGNTNPLTITVDGPKNITASFQAYAVATAVTPAGTGTVNRSPYQTYYARGTTVSLDAVANPGYQFDSWSGDLTGSQNPSSLIVYGNQSVTAAFVLTPATCGAWSLIPADPRPSPRYRSAAIWDPVRHRVLVYGGLTFSPAGDTWALTMGASPAWSLVVSGSNARGDCAAVYDPVRDRFIIYGGTSGSGFHFNDAYALPLTGAPTWAQIAASGTPPAPRIDPSVIYDPLRDRLLVFGGSIRCGLGCATPQNDVWQLTLAGTPTWTQLAPAGTPPPPRASAGAIYDPVRDRMVIMAGAGANPNGAWVLSLAGTPTWTDLAPWGVPRSAYGGPGFYDPTRDRALLLQSDGAGISALDFRDQPNQPLWCKISPSGNLGARYGASAVYDPDDDAAIVFAGRTPGGDLLDTSFRLDLGGGFLLDAGGSHGTVVVDRWCHSSGEIATLQAVPDQGYHLNQWLGDASGSSNPLEITMNGYKVIRAEFITPGAVDEEPPAAFALSVRPNPTAGSGTIEYSLPHEALVRVRVFDIAGREVARLVDGLQPAGRHVAKWGEASGGVRPRAGIYLVRFETPEGTWTRSLALLR